MSDGTETSAEVAQPAGDELADLMAGYNAGAAEAPPAASQAETAQPDAGSHEAQVTAQPGEVEQPSGEDQPQAVPSIEDRLAELKAEIRAQAQNGSQADVRKLYGEIGAINRTLQELKPAPKPPEPAPVDAELTAAMEGVDRVAEDFAELGAPIASAVKALANKVNSLPAPAAPQAVSQEQIDATINARLAEQRRRDAEESLVVDHPDFNTVIRSQAFEAWVSTKPADQQATIRNTQNPLLASRFLTDFKASQQVRQQKQSRLAAAVTPTGVAKPAAPSKLSAEEEIMLGYQQAGPRPLHKR